MKVSASNQLRGQITRIERGEVNAELEISIGGDDRLIAIASMDSLRMLGLQVGTPVVALVKAPMVMLMARADGSPISARNALAGTIMALGSGSVNVDVSLQLAGGSTLTAVVTRDGLAELGLQVGSPVCAVIKSSSVILALEV